MKPVATLLAVLSAIGLCSATRVSAQGLPKTQPKLITVVREEVKTGRNAEHARHEAGWPAAFEKAKSTTFYVAMTSMTGPNEAWFIIPAESHAAISESMKKEDKDEVLSAELDRLSLGDAQYIERATTFQAMARTDLSVGSFPDVTKARFLEMTFFRVRPGHSTQFEEAAKAYAAARQRAEPKAGYRFYQVITGMPSPTYLIVASVEDYGEFDQVMAAGMATWKEATDQEKAVLEKASSEALISIEANRYRVDPKQSYVPKETRDNDPEFWGKK